MSISYDELLAGETVTNGYERIEKEKAIIRQYAESIVEDVVLSVYQSVLYA
jgi:hypothetical protein